MGLDIAEAGLVIAPELAQVSDPSIEVVDAAQGAISELRVVIGEVAVLTEEVGASGEDLVTVLEGVSTLTREDVPQTLAAVETSLPALLDTASVIDNTMRTLSVLGVQYNPAVPFDESLREVQANLDGLPEQIAAQGDVIASTIPAVTDSSRRLAGLGDSFRSMDADLAAAEDALGGYDSALVGLDTFAEVAQNMGAAIPAARIALIIFAAAGVALAVGAWELGRRIDGVIPKSEDATGLERE